MWQCVTTMRRIESDSRPIARTAPRIFPCAAGNTRVDQDQSVVSIEDEGVDEAEPDLPEPRDNGFHSHRSTSARVPFRPMGIVVSSPSYPTPLRPSSRPAWSFKAPLWRGRAWRIIPGPNRIYLASACADLPLPGTVATPGDCRCVVPACGRAETRSMSRTSAVMASICVVSSRLSAARQTARAQERPYRSPYRVEFSVPLSDLIGDLDARSAAIAALRRSSRTRNGTCVMSNALRPRLGSRCALLSGSGRPRSLAGRAGNGSASSPSRCGSSVTAISTTISRTGTHRSHWPWKPTFAGSNGRGIDCSNLTGFVYNLGFGSGSAQTSTASRKIGSAAEFRQWARGASRRHRTAVSLQGADGIPADGRPGVHPEPRREHQSRRDLGRADRPVAGRRTAGDRLPWRGRPRLQRPADSRRRPAPAVPRGFVVQPQCQPRPADHPGLKTI